MNAVTETELLSRFGFYKGALYVREESSASSPTSISGLQRRSTGRAPLPAPRGGDAARAVRGDPRPVQAGGSSYSAETSSTPSIG
ncbi:hypothetical protein [Methanoculleus chikugoensis]|uniref:hypothetical protein n=1 Tax=Methanoculleus chikugoensis TaxID=118126 RepID=UPI001FB2EC59|nr:hypothetical protein [Methanoculleus chikugoensis]